MRRAVTPTISRPGPPRTSPVAITPTYARPAASTRRRSSTTRRARGCDSRLLARTREAVLVQAVEQRATRDAEHVGRLRLIALALLEGLHDLALLGVGHLAT